MNVRWPCWLACLCVATVLAAADLGARGAVPAPQQAPQQPAFATFDVFVDAGEHALAAWQLEVRFATAKLVGVEGGEPAAFRDAPHYDPKALQGGVIVLAALAASSGDAAAPNARTLPTGRVRVARLHVMAPDGAFGEHAVRGVVAADAEGERFATDIEVRRHEDK